MVTNTAGKASVETASRFAYAAGFTGILANLSLVAMYLVLGLQAWNSEAQTASLGPAGALTGSASDLVGSLSFAFMIPVALALGRRLPRRRATRFTQATGLAAMTFLTVGGPLLVLGVLTFEAETPLAMAAWVVLCLWLLMVNRWLRSSAALSARMTRLGELFGTGMLAGYVIVGLGLLLPWMSSPQLVVFGVGALVGLPAYLGIPVWFVLLGRHLAS